MIKLYIIFTHGGATLLDSKIVTRQLIQAENQGVTTIFAHYINNEERLHIGGSSVIDQWLQDQSTKASHTSEDKFALIKQLIEKAKHHFQLRQDEICVLCEGNFTETAGNELPDIVLDLLNIIQPGIAILPTGTPLCCWFIDLWRQTHHYPKLVMNNEKGQFLLPALQEEQVITQELKDSCTAKIRSMRLTFSPPPAIISFDKKENIFCLKRILEGTYLIENIRPEEDTQDQTASTPRFSKLFGIFCYCFKTETTSSNSEQLYTPTVS